MGFFDRVLGGKYGTADNQLSRPTIGNRIANSLVGATTMGFVDPNFSTKLAGDLPTISSPEFNPIGGVLGLSGLGLANLAVDADQAFGTNIALGTPMGGLKQAPVEPRSQIADALLKKEKTSG